jgi:copper chaperone CopZ
MQVLVLRVSIHCEGCKKKVKKVLQHVDGMPHLILPHLYCKFVPWIESCTYPERFICVCITK